MNSTFIVVVVCLLYLLIESIYLFYLFIISENGCILWRVVSVEGDVAGAAPQSKCWGWSDVEGEETKQKTQRLGII